MLRGGDRDARLFRRADGVDQTKAIDVEHCLGVVGKPCCTDLRVGAPLTQSEAKTVRGCDMGAKHLPAFLRAFAEPRHTWQRRAHVNADAVGVDREDSEQIRVAELLEERLGHLGIAVKELGPGARIAWGRSRFDQLDRT